VPGCKLLREQNVGSLRLTVRLPLAVAASLEVQVIEPHLAALHGMMPSAVSHVQQISDSGALRTFSCTLRQFGNQDVHTRQREKCIVSSNLPRTWKVCDLLATTTIREGQPCVQEARHSHGRRAANRNCIDSTCQGAQKRQAVKQQQTCAPTPYIHRPAHLPLQLRQQRQRQHRVRDVVDAKLALETVFCVRQRRRLRISKEKCPAGCSEET